MAFNRAFITHTKTTDLQGQMGIFNRIIQEMSAKIKTEQQFLDMMLINAIESSNHKKMDLLLQLGAHIEACNSQGENTLLIACKQKTTDTIQCLLRYTENMQMISYLYHAITSTAFPSFPKPSQLFLVNQLLLKASETNNLSMVDFALTHGAQLDAHDPTFETALHKACRSNHVEIVKFLLSKNHPILKQNHEGQVPSDLTTHAAIQELIVNQKHQSATTIQAHVRGFFGRKEFAQLKEQYRNEINEASVQAFTILAQNSQFDDIIKLATAIKTNRLQDAMEIIQATVGDAERQSLTSYSDSDTHSEFEFIDTPPGL